MEHIEKKEPIKTICKTKYPIMLIHGIGYIDEKLDRYWGTIPKFLQERGAQIFFGGQDAFGSIEHNAAQLKVSAEQVLECTGAEKINLIAHSKGGIEARYMISKLGMAEQVASLTTLATPHRGIRSMDEMKSEREQVYRILLKLFNRMLTIGGGQSNLDLKAYDQLTADFMNVFNELVPDVKDVYYQSYAFDMKNSRSHAAMGLFYKLIKKREGMNDGLVSVQSAKWGDFQGVFPKEGKLGISHCTIVNSGKDPFSRRKSIDMTPFYQEVVSRLKGLGY